MKPAYRKQRLGGGGVTLVERPQQLALEEVNAYRCSLVTYPDNGTAARHSEFQITGARAGGSGSGFGTATLGRFMHAQWHRGSKRKLLEVSCVVPMTAAVTEALKTGFALELAAAVEAHRRSGGEAALQAPQESVRRPVERWGPATRDFSGDIIWCTYYEHGDLLICDGVPCTNEAELRWSDLNRIAMNAIFGCPNGCYVNPAVGFWCGWGGSGGVGEGGGPGEGGGGGGSGGGGGCPNSDPECLLDLRYQDEQKVRQALATVDTARAICAEAGSKIGAMLRLGQLYRGNPHIPDDPDDDHDGQARVGTLGFDSFIHIDTDFLNSSSAGALASVLLHEAWHVLGHEDHEGELGPPYGTYPYSEQQSCIVGS